MYSVIAHVFGDRILPADNHPIRILRCSQRLFPEEISRKSEPSSSQVPLSGDDAVVVIGLRLSPSQSHRIVDRGPRPDDPLLALRFQAIHGPPSLRPRRFKDGQILLAHGIGLFFLKNIFV